MNNKIRSHIKRHYGSIAAKVSKKTKSSCCSSKCNCEDISDTSVLYNGINLRDLPIEAINASLGCANPLVFAELKEGESVLDLGSGGGIDVLMASKYIGKSGKVYGLDMTDEMLHLANQNKEKMGVANVEFIKGYIEEIPLPNESVDAIISNCVINLSEDKEKAITEAYRVLKPNGRIAIADIIALKDIPSSVRNDSDLWCGCIAGALSKEAYFQILEKAGFKNISISPVHVYSKSVIHQEQQNQEQNHPSVIPIPDDMDGAFAGAQIKAWK